MNEVGGSGIDGWICGRCIRIAFSYRTAPPTLAALVGADAGVRASCEVATTPDAGRTSGHSEAERLAAAAERVVVGVVGTSDEGELLRPGDEP